MTLSRRRLALIAVAAVAALALGFAAAKVFGPGRSQPAHATAASGSPAATTPAPAAKAAPTAPAAPAPGGAGAAAVAPATVLPTALPEISVTEPRTGFRISYPRAWTRLPAKDPTRPLLLASRDGVSLLVRAVRLSQPIDGPRLAVLRDATGALIRGRRAVQIIAGPRLLASANLPGFLYIYSFYDPLSRQRVAHSQISLFSGRRMFTLVFQTARAADITRFAMLFDKITASFRAI